MLAAQWKPYRLRRERNAVYGYELVNYEQTRGYPRGVEAWHAGRGLCDCRPRSADSGRRRVPERRRPGDALPYATESLVSLTYPCCRALVSAVSVATVRGTENLLTYLLAGKLRARAEETLAYPRK